MSGDEYANEDGNVDLFGTSTTMCKILCSSSIIHFLRDLTRYLTLGTTQLCPSINDWPGSKNPSSKMVQFVSDTGEVLRRQTKQQKITVTNRVAWIQPTKMVVTIFISVVF